MFGWKFVPTLIAVLYTQLAAMILGAMKRTEPFARLAKHSGRVPLARHTMLEKSRPWWTTLVHGLQKGRNGGSLSWPIVLSCTAFILATLSISPLSATLLSSKEVQSTSPAELSRFSLDSPSLARPRIDRETYLRTNAAILQNYSTSPWASNEYFVVPFWPKDLTHSPWNFRTTERQTWEAETTVFRNDYTCSELRMSSKAFHLTSSYLKNSYSASVIMKSEDGCQYNITRKVATDSVITPERNSQIGSWTQIPWVNDANIQDRSDRIEPMNNCTQEESIIMSTAWYGNREPSDFLPNFDITAYVCHNNHTMAKIPVRASSGSTGLSVEFDKDVFDKIRHPVPDSVMNIPGLRSLYTDPDWYNYIPQKGYLNISLGLFGGASVLLGTKHRFNISEMMNDPDLAVSAAQMRRRVFSEIMQTSLQNPSDSRTEAVTGSRTASEIRIVVNPQIAIILCSLFLASFCILLTLMWTARLSHRPLNLYNDPSTVVGLGALISSKVSILSMLKTLDLANRKRLKLEFAERQFSVSHGTLEEVTPGEKSREEGGMCKLHLDNLLMHDDSSRYITSFESSHGTCTKNLEPYRTGRLHSGAFSCSVHIVWPITEVEPSSGSLHVSR